MPQLAPSATTIPLITFARRLAVRTDHGMHPAEALRQVAEEFQATGDAADAKIATAANAVAASMDAGEYGWHEQADTFGEYFASAAYAGHQAGFLPRALNDIADALEAEIRTGYTDAPLVRLLNARIAFARRVADGSVYVSSNDALTSVASQFKESGTNEDAQLAAAAEAIANEQRHGAGAEAWLTHQDILGEHLAAMAAFGERAGDLPRALRDAANTLESDLRALLIPQAALNAEILENA